MEEKIKMRMRDRWIGWGKGMERMVWKNEDKEEGKLKEERKEGRKEKREG